MLKLFSTRKVILLTTVMLVLLTVVFLLANTTLAQTDLYGVGYGSGAGLSSTDIRVSIIKVIRVVLGILGIIALAIIIYGGVVWMTSQGNPVQIERSEEHTSELQSH